MSTKIIVMAAFGLLFVSVGLAQQPNYKAIFSTDYQRAHQFLTRKKIDSIILSHGLNPKAVTAIAFPELIRYNAIHDKIETFALETLYVQYGKDYANFSVGEFQIKPSFAESLEIDFQKTFGINSLKEFHLQSSDTVQNQSNRLSRLKRTKDKTGMVNYLCMYFKVMLARYPNWSREEDKIKFLACAYNCGYQKTREEINAFLSKKYFHAGLQLASKKYSYADIAWDYFVKQP